MNNYTKYIYQLDILRGLAAVAVVLFHFKPFIEYILPNKSYLFNGGSYLGISLFFILSGFVISLSTVNQTNVLIFIIKRIFRVYIPLIMATLIHVYIKETEFDLLSLLLVIPQGGAPPYYGYGLYFIAWTLVYELFFYLLFAISMMISKKNRFNILISIILFNCFILQTFLTKDFSFAPGSINNIKYNLGYFNVVLSFLINPINLLFIIGVLFFKYVDQIKAISRAFNFSILTYLISITVSGIGYFYMTGHGIFEMGVFSIFIFFITLLFHFKNEKGTNNIVTKLFIYIGQLSYSLYLVHYIAIDLRYYYLPWVKGFPSTKGAPVQFDTLVVFIAIIVLTLCFYYLIDKPSMKIGKVVSKRIKKEGRLTF